MGLQRALAGSLSIGTTAIAEGTVDAVAALVNLAISTAITGNVDLSVVLSSCFCDLLAVDICRAPAGALQISMG